MAIFDDEDWSFLDYEASIVEDWPEELQSLVDKGIVKVEYDDEDKAHFSLTELGNKVYREVGLEFN